MYDFGECAHNRLQLFHTGMNPRRFFECQIRRRPLALIAKLAKQRVSTAIEIALNALYFGCVFLVGTTLKAGSKAHLHLRINASWELGIRVQIVDATPHLEK